MAIKIEAGYTDRRFDIDWPQPLPDHKKYDVICNTLLDEPNATEVFSGHTSIIVVLRDDARTDVEIIQSLSNRLREIGLEVSNV